VLKFPSMLNKNFNTFCAPKLPRLNELVIEDFY
jgi:hypothetical protein